VKRDGAAFQSGGMGRGAAAGKRDGQRAAL